MEMVRIFLIREIFLLADIVLVNLEDMENFFGKIKKIIKDFLIKDKNKDLEFGENQIIQIEINMKDNFLKIKKMDLGHLIGVTKVNTKDNLNKI